MRGVIVTDDGEEGKCIGRRGRDVWASANQIFVEIIAGCKENGTGGGTMLRADFRQRGGKFTTSY